MAQVTFTMPIDLPTAATPEIPAPKKFEFSWDLFFTIALLMGVFVGFIWWWQFSKRNASTNPDQCTQDGAMSTGTYGSDCCSTNGVDSDGKCRSKSPMGIPPYGMTNSATPDYTTNAQYTPALIATPPVPYVSTGAPPAPPYEMTTPYTPGPASITTPPSATPDFSTDARYSASSMTNPAPVQTSRPVSRQPRQPRR